MKFVEVSPTATDSLRQAVCLPMVDFEDAMQVAAALACGADFIVTRNTRDFRNLPVPAVTPRSALARLG